MINKLTNKHLISATMVLAATTIIGIARAQDYTTQFTPNHERGEELVTDLPPFDPAANRHLVNPEYQRQYQQIVNGQPRPIYTQQRPNYGNSQPRVSGQADYDREYSKADQARFDKLMSGKQ